MTMIYIMRHGETEMNRQRRMQGHIDTPLSEEGKLQACRAANRFREAGVVFDRVYSSPLSRAKESAALVANIREEEIIVDDRLIEFHYGSFEGRSYEDLDGVMADFLHDPENVPPPAGVERLEELNARVSGFLDDRIGELTAAGTVLLMVHGIVIRSMYGYFNRIEAREMWKIMVGNCEIFRVELKDKTYGLLERLNEGGAP